MRESSGLLSKKSRLLWGFIPMLKARTEERGPELLGQRKFQASAARNSEPCRRARRPHSARPNRARRTVKTGLGHARRQRNFRHGGWIAPTLPSQVAWRAGRRWPISLGKVESAHNQERKQI